MACRGPGEALRPGRVHTFACFDIAEARMVPQRSEADQAPKLLRIARGRGGGQLRTTEKINRTMRCSTTKTVRAARPA